MALTDQERAFMQAARDAGYSDEEVVAKVQERRQALPAGPPADRITPDELAALGSSPSALRQHLDQTDRAEKFRGDVNLDDLKTEQDLQDYLAAGNKLPPGYRVNHQFDESQKAAHDFLGMAAAGVGGQLTRAIPVVGRALQGGALARAAGGAAEGAGAGAAQGAMEMARGGSVGDAVGGTLLGTALGGVQALPSGGPRAPRAPQSQAEMDAALLSRARANNLLDTPEYKALPEGAAGTSVLATRAEQLAAERMGARKAAAGTALGTAEEEARATLAGRRLNTTHEIEDIQGMRRQRSGQAGPLNPEVDNRLSEIQRQLGLRPHNAAAVDTGGIPEPVPGEGGTVRIPRERMGDIVPRGRGGVDPWARLGPDDVEGALADTRRINMNWTPPRPSAPPAPSLGTPRLHLADPPLANFDDLRSLQRELNFRTENRVPGDYGSAADAQAAGTVRGAVRRFDPRLGPGSFGGALDRYGAEEGRLNRMGELLYGQDGSLPPEGLARQEAGRARLARAGTADEVSGQGAYNNEARLRELSDLEPALDMPITQLGARNTLDRRQVRLPIPHAPHPYAAAKAIGQQASNIAFYLHPPRIDAEGMVAGQAARGDMNSLLPFEVNPLARALSDERKKSRQRASFLQMNKEADAREAQRQQMEDMMRSIVVQQQAEN